MTNKRRIIFLCGEAEGDAFRTHVAEIAPEVETQWVASVASLDFATRRDGERTRLISFLTDVIVPARILERLGPTPYNIHPGSPDYPGAHGLSFAIYEEAEVFGVTVHEMAASVDTGAIVRADRFPLPSEAELLQFGSEVYAHAVQAAAKVIEHAVRTDDLLPHARESWASRQCTRAKLNALLTSADYLLPADRARLRRACGPHWDKHMRAQASHG
ncbi:MAG: formyltransferase family protein [Pseudomonadota bacterium]